MPALGASTERVLSKFIPASIFDSRILLLAHSCLGMGLAHVNTERMCAWKSLAADLALAAYA